LKRLVYKMAEQIYCTECGKGVVDGTVFCGACGNRYTHDVPTISEDSSLVANRAIKLFETLFSPGTYTNTSDWQEEKILAIATLNSLRPIYSGYAEAQVENAPEDLLFARGVIEYTLPALFPQIYEKFSSQEAKTSLRDFYLEVMEFGCLMTMPGIGFIAPEKTIPLKQVNFDAIKDAMLYRAQQILPLPYELRGLNKYEDQIEGMAKKSWGIYSDRRVRPFFKSHGVKSGFMFANIGKPLLHSKAHFYIGVTLSMVYTSALKGEL